MRQFWAWNHLKTLGVNVKKNIIKYNQRFKYNIKFQYQSPCSLWHIMSVYYIVTTIIKVVETLEFFIYCFWIKLSLINKWFGS
jgi:hypothetical protein